MPSGEEILIYVIIAVGVIFGGYELLFAGSGDQPAAVAHQKRFQNPSLRPWLLGHRSRRKSGFQAAWRLRASPDIPPLVWIE